jgi:hypothetical protein
MNSGPEISEMIDDHAPLSSFTSTARQALVWHPPFRGPMTGTPNRGDKVEEIRFPSTSHFAACKLFTSSGASMEGQSHQTHTGII